MHCDSPEVAHAIIIFRPEGRIQFETRGTLTIIETYTQKSLGLVNHGNYSRTYPDMPSPTKLRANLGNYSLTYIDKPSPTGPTNLRVNHGNYSRTCTDGLSPTNPTKLWVNHGNYSHEGTDGLSPIQPYQVKGQPWQLQSHMHR